MNNNSKDRIKFAYRELEAALTNFETNVLAEGAAALPNSVATRAGIQARSANHRANLRQEKLDEIKRQLREIREQLDCLS